MSVGKSGDNRARQILVIGNLGYVGPWVIHHLRQAHQTARLIGLDSNWFSPEKIGVDYRPSFDPDHQIYGDVRDWRDHLTLDAYDTIIYLAAVSNDQIANQFKSATHNINAISAAEIAKKFWEIEAKEREKLFIYASSCSLYGKTDSHLPCKETDPIHPRTDYARSKNQAEDALKQIATESTKKHRLVSLRFATACGVSFNQRTDLILNDFVSRAVRRNQIEVFSDRTPLRPLIDVEDMGRVVSAMTKAKHASPFSTYNVGTNGNNYSVLDLANIVAQTLNKPNIVEIKNCNGGDDRSYKVDFSKLNAYLKAEKINVPFKSVETTIHQLFKLYSHPKYIAWESTSEIRLASLQKYILREMMDQNLRWIKDDKK